MTLYTNENEAWEGNRTSISPKYDTGSGVGENYLNLACENFSVLGRIIRDYGDHTLLDYLSLIEPKNSKPFQSKDDLLDAIEDYVAPLLGKTIAKKAAADLERSPLVLTANHHGVTYFAQDFQGNLIFALNRFSKQPKRHTIPIFACGSVPLDNLTYPLGLLCYRTGNDDVSAIPKKVPVFSNKMRRQMVSCGIPFDDQMVSRAQNRAQKLIREHTLCPTLGPSIQTLLRKEYRRSQVLDLATYSRQAVVLNSAIWNRLFDGVAGAPNLVNVELEVMSSALLRKDLKNTNSLASCIMFDVKLRNHLIRTLDGNRACWKTEVLARRLCSDPTVQKENISSNGSGTMFFWGVDNRGRRVPLYLNGESANQQALSGIDDRGNVITMPFSTKAIDEGLASGKLLPSLFTSFLVVSLARGVACAGGYFQCEYLPAMQHGIVEALKQTDGYDVVAHQVASVTTDTYLSGMIAVMSRVGDDCFVPAGPIEMLAGGGLNDTEITRLQALTVKDAHLCALSETLQDLPVEKKDTLPPGWETELAMDRTIPFEDRIIIR